MTTYQASPSEMFRSPASRFRSVSAGNSPQRVMSPQFPPSGSPRPLYDGYSGLEDQFNTFAFMGRPSSAHTSRAAMPPQGYPRLPHGMPPPIVSGSPDDAFDAFNSSMLLQDASPMRRRSNVYQPLPPGGSAYPYPTYPGPLPPPAPHGQYPPNASSPRRRSHTPSPEFFDLRQLPRY
ncbi:hypothetical protein DFH07DRAFT_456155 [Mycena maculata]|uniref:Uncharacterized protein n=1 Tax=Mycena maculata TaxID=230809 RepID=A0AAD7JAG7_9AGAR|nr:hypothetical protein DFH07DRAFT_456155 [Mycena maculata]